MEEILRINNILRNQNQDLTIENYELKALIKEINIDVYKKNNLSVNCLKIVQTSNKTWRNKKDTSKPMTIIKFTNSSNSLNKTKMETKDDAILKMLKDGKSYTDIIASLSVSPSKIAVVKKRNQDTLKPSNDALLGTTTTASVPPPPPLYQLPEETMIAIPDNLPYLIPGKNVPPPPRPKKEKKARITNIKSYPVFSSPPLPRLPSPPPLPPEPVKKNEISEDVKNKAKQRLLAITKKQTDEKRKLEQDKLYNEVIDKIKRR